MRMRIRYLVRICTACTVGAGLQINMIANILAKSLIH